MREAGARIGVDAGASGGAVRARAGNVGSYPIRSGCRVCPCPGRCGTRRSSMLHELMIPPPGTRWTGCPESAELGAARRAEIVQAAADEATVSVLARLSTFEGRSKFTTWAYKFGILHAGVELRRVAWRGREIDLGSIPEPSAPARSRRSGGGP